MPTTLTKKTLANIFTPFSRASAACRWNEQGVIESVAANLPRIDHDPLTLVTNHFKNSEFAGATAGAGAGAVAQLSGFPGFTTGVNFLGAAASAYTLPAVKPSTRYCISAYVRMDDGGLPRGGAVNSAAVDFTFVIANAAAPAANHNFIDLGNGVYRCWAWYDTPEAVPNLGTGIWKYAAQATRGFKATGFQLEEGVSTPSRYVKTEMIVPVSRALPRGLLMEETRTNFAYPSMMGLNADYYTVSDASSVFAAGVARRYMTKGTGGPNLPPQGVTFSSVGWMCASAIVEADPASAGPINTRLIFYRTGSSGAIKVGVIFSLATGAVTVEGSGYSTGGLISGSKKLMHVGPNGGPVWLVWIAQENVAAETLAAYPYPLTATTPADAGKSVFVHHFQLEAGTFPTSPIVTTTAAATRAADGARLDKQDWYNPLASTLLIDLGPGTIMSNTTSSTNPYYNTFALSKDKYQDGLLGISGGGANTGLASVDGRIQVSAWSTEGGNQSRMFPDSSSPGGGSIGGGKVALTSDGNEQQGARNGVLVPGMPLKAPMTVGQTNIDRLVINGRVNGWIKSLRYIPRRVNDAELIALTAP